MYFVKISLIYHFRQKNRETFRWTEEYFRQKNKRTEEYILFLFCYMFFCSSV